jgi:hypothetical protein
MSCFFGNHCFLFHGYIMTRGRQAPEEYSTCIEAPEIVMKMPRLRGNLKFYSAVHPGPLLSSNIAHSCFTHSV